MMRAHREVLHKRKRLANNSANPKLPPG